MEVDKMAALSALPFESSFSAAPTDASSNVASLSSTPPTTVADSISLASDTPKPDNAPVIVVEETIEASVTVALGEPADPEPETQHTPSPGRARRARTSVAHPVYNISKLSGTAGHGKRRANGDEVRDKRRRTISGDTLVSNGDAPAPSSSTDRLLRDGIEALDLQWSIRGPNTPRGARALAKKAKDSSSRRISTRSAGEAAESLATKVSSLGKRGRKIFEKANRMSRELKRLQDTNEFAHIDTKPIRHTVWSNGKFIDPDEIVEDEAPARKKSKVQKEVAEEEPEPEKKEEVVKGPKQRRVKKYLEKGLYAGQDSPMDITKGLSIAEKKKLSELPELLPSGKLNKTLPMPIYNGFRVLLNGRDFKLPFDICNPLPPGQPKPDEWRKMTRNRFIGDAATYWRKTDHFKDYQSKCVCTRDDGCAEDCQNRIMLYECDDTNCNVGKDRCHNRAFQNLQERTKKGGRFRVGVEVLKTSDRGYGVRTNRCFEPNQIIMEYTGEIITEEECERRMNEIYKDNECYYLMSFDQNMIIDATTGNIARFVNHSCSPNCRMEKWIVGGQPRMALFAGPRPIQTGDELTYDYNFDPFSAKNVQKCLCGSANCRGVLGPKPKEVKVPKPPKEVKSPKKKKSVKATLKATAKATVKGGKRKLQELLAGGEDEADTNSTKKRKIKPAKGIKRSLSSASLKSLKGAAKGAATVVRKTASSISVNARAALGPKTPAATIRKSSSTSTLKTYSKSGKGGQQLKLAASRSSSLTIVARPDSSDDENIKPGNSKGGKRSPKGSLKSIKSRKSILTSPASSKITKKKTTPKSMKSPRKGLEISRAAKIRLVDDEE